MKIRQPAIAACVVIVLLTITVWLLRDRDSSEPLLTRLNREIPVHQGEVRFVELNVDGKTVEGGIPAVSVRIGGKLSVTGMIDDGAWGLSGVKIVAKSDASGGRGIRPGDRRLTLSLELYDNSVELKPFAWEVVYTNHLRKEIEFETEVVVPDEPGEYVADLMLYDETPAPRGQENRRIGFPIARIPLEVRDE
jgi:hypothetical protein